jgi:hypothetical protein
MSLNYQQSAKMGGVIQKLDKKTFYVYSVNRVSFVPKQSQQGKYLPEADTGGRK